MLWVGLTPGKTNGKNHGPLWIRTSSTRFLQVPSQPLTWTLLSVEKNLRLMNRNELPPDGPGFGPISEGVKDTDSM